MEDRETPLMRKYGESNLGSLTPGKVNEVQLMYLFQIKQMYCCLPLIYTRCD